MKKIIIILILLKFINLNSSSQTINIKTGLAQTSLPGFFDYKGYVNKFFFIGFDYDLNKKISLSTELGILNKGGKLTDEKDISGNPININLKVKTLEINPLIKYTPISIGNVNFYCGAGPKFDIHIDKKHEIPEIYNDYEKFSKCTFGVTATIGTYYDYSQLRLGASYAYNLDLTNTETIHKAKNKIHLFCISIGYKFIK